MASSDWAAWVQAIGSLIGIGIAIWVPFHIHVREEKSATKVRAVYKSILVDALQNLRKPIVELRNVDDEVMTIEKGLALHPEKAGTRVLDALQGVRGAVEVLEELDARDRLDTFGAVRTMFEFRKELRSFSPLVEAEARILAAHKTDKTVAISISKLADPAERLLATLDAALDALEKTPA